MFTQVFAFVRFKIEQTRTNLVPIYVVGLQPSPGNISSYNHIFTMRVRSKQTLLGNNNNNNKGQTFKKDLRLRKEITKCDSRKT